MMRNTLLAAGFAFSALAAAAPARAANLVQNPGFENPTLSPWTVSGDDIAIDTSNPNSGLQDAAFFAAVGDPTPDVLSQAITTTVGTAYTLSFAVLDEGGDVSDTFSVSFGSFKATITGNNATSYTTETYSIPGSDITDVLYELDFQGLSGTYTAWNLDDVSLTAAAVPEPSAALLLGFGALAMFGVSLARKLRT